MKIRSGTLSELQHSLLEQRLTFASWRLPGERLPYTLVSDKAYACESLDEVPADRGFILAPFPREKSPVVVIPGCPQHRGWNVEFKPQQGSHELLPSDPDQPLLIDYDSYSRQVEGIRALIREGRVEKVVLSRVKQVADVRTSVLPSLFAELAAQYPQAFIYLVNTPQSGIWLGASPESLVRTDSESFTTMALAGTKAFNGGSGIVWSDKEIREQAHVLRYIQQKLAAAGYPFQESSLQTIKAGGVVHLRSMFAGVLKSGPSDWREIVKVLFPTPAVCGTEEHIALEVIKNTEAHERQYYTGFLGPFDDAGKSDIFVNLRCMKIARQQAFLFAGGGILAESDPQKEWEETELKFNTLSEVIDRIKKTSV